MLDLLQEPTHILSILDLIVVITSMFLMGWLVGLVSGAEWMRHLYRDAIAEWHESRKRQREYNART
jgi:hypothetical protein